jgi:excisionase family DNA binding protein
MENAFQHRLRNGNSSTPKPGNGFEALITAADLAEALGVSIDWVLKRWQEGVLPGFRLTYGRGRGVRFRLSEIDAWLETRREGPQPSSTAAGRNGRGRGDGDGERRVA